MDKETALYLRVSHRDQSHASQLPDMERWAEAHDGPTEWFKDTFTGHRWTALAWTGCSRNCEPVG